mgnify:CR=1 FL=1
MDSIITFFCIVGLCIFMYSYIRMRQQNKDYPLSCNVLYLPRDDKMIKDKLPHMEVLDHEEHDETFRHTIFNKAPMGRSEIEDMIPLLNQRTDRSVLREMGE